MIVADALLDWITYRAKLCNLGLVAKSTVENQSQIAGGLIDRLGTVDLDRLRKSDIELWMGERLRTCAPVTVRGELNVLRQVLNWCMDEQHLTAKPRLPTLCVPNTEATLPSDEAFLWVLGNVPPQHARALEFMMLTGLSPHELERVQVRDASAYRRMSDDFTLGSPGELGELGIGQRPDFAVKQPSRRRWVPLNNRARAIWYEVTAGLERTASPFPGVEAMQKAIRRAVDRPANVADIRAGLPVGLAAITPRLMRKWFASKVSSDQPEHVLQRLLGHAPGSPITRRHYVRSTDAELTRAVAGVGA